MAKPPVCKAWRHRSKPVTMTKHGAPDNGIQRYKCGRCGRLKIKRVYCWLGTHRYKTRIRGRKLPPSKVKCSKCGRSKSTKDL